jgi:signal transduction histidine kinase
MPSGPVTVYAAIDVDQVEETLAHMRGLALTGTPLLLALAGVSTWLIVGWALRPVEAIRRQVEVISAQALDQRISEPTVDDEIGQLTHTMNAMLHRLETSTERQRRFVADASHELKSPLAILRNEVEVALAHPEAGDWQSTATSILEESERMGRLVQDLLFLAHSDEGRAAAPGADIDLDDVVLAEVSRLRLRGRVQVDSSRVSAAPVTGRAEQLSRVARNLLENAERYARSTITVELRFADGRVQLVVADDGPGIPPEDRERIFERFTRLYDPNSPHDGGSGLGLAIAKEIVETHGGHIWVENAAVGARFVIDLPAAHP